MNERGFSGKERRIGGNRQLAYVYEMRRRPALLLLAALSAGAWPVLHSAHAIPASQASAKGVDKPIRWMSENPRSGPATALVFSPDGKTLAAGFYDSFIKLFDAASGNEMRVFHEDGGVCRLVFSPDGRILAAGNTDGIIRLWDVGTGRVEGRVKSEDGQFPLFGFSSDSGLLVIADQDILRFLEIPSCRIIKTTALPSGTLTALSPDGKWAAAQHDNLISVLNVSTGQAVGTVSAPPPPGYALYPYEISFSPDGAWMGSPWGKGIVLYKMFEPRARANLIGHAKEVRMIAFSSGSELLASGDLSGEIKLWETGADGERASLRGGVVRAGWVFSLAFSRDGQALAAGYQGGQIIVWSVEVR